MDSASRHAQRLAHNFLDDLDTMQRASRARDKRAMSHFDGGVEEPIPRVIHSTVSRRVPHRGVRLTSVPPSVPLTTATTSATYRPMIYTTESSLPPVAPTSYYRTRRYVTETPYYTTSYVEPATTKYRTYTSVTPAPSYTYYYYPPVGKPYSSIRRYGSQGSLSNEMLSERKRIERRMDNVLDYKLPPPEYYHDMRNQLRGLHDKLDEHRRLIDRYSGIDMNAAPSTTEDRIESKYQQLASRLARPSTVTARG